MSLYKAVALESNKELEDFILSKAAKQFYARGNQERFDLFPFYSILVSTGINKNTDAFDPIEVWRARHSPADKPVNIGHKQTHIIGHIIDNIVVGEDLKPIPEDIDEGDLPEKLHVITAAVIYRIWEDPVVQAEVNSLIDQIAKGSIFVSMECLFRDFDYLLTTASGEQKVIPRNSQTSALTKYLRAYKGPGKIHNYSIARLLKNITFSAVGIVKQPANPDSIISASLDLFSSNANELVYLKIDSNNMENTMAQEVQNTTENPALNPVEDHPNYKKLKDQHDQLQNNHTALQHAHETLKHDHDLMKKDHEHLHGRVGELNRKLEEVHKKTMAETDNNNEETMKEMADLKATIATLNDRVVALEGEKTTLSKANDALNATVEEFKKASKHTNCAEAMMSVDTSLGRDSALRLVAQYDELSDSSFASMIELMKGYASRTPQPVTPESILNGAKAEAEVQYGAAEENKFTKTTADIKNFLNKNKTTNKKGL